METTRKREIGATIRCRWTGRLFVPVSPFQGREETFMSDHPFMVFLCDNAKKTVQLIARVASVSQGELQCQTLAKQVDGQLKSVDSKFLLDLVNGQCHCRC